MHRPTPETSHIPHDPDYHRIADPYERTSTIAADMESALARGNIAQCLAILDALPESTEPIGDPREQKNEAGIKAKVASQIAPKLLAVGASPADIDYTLFTVGRLGTNLNYLSTRNEILAGGFAGQDNIHLEIPAFLAGIDLSHIEDPGRRAELILLFELHLEGLALWGEDVMTTQIDLIRHLIEHNNDSEKSHFDHQRLFKYIAEGYLRGGHIELGLTLSPFITTPTLRKPHAEYVTAIFGENPQKSLSLLRQYRPPSTS